MQTFLQVPILEVSNANVSTSAYFRDNTKFNIVFSTCASFIVFHKFIVFLIVLKVYLLV